jgi:hypothetical protein
MRTTVDIPDAVYRQLKAKAALAGQPVKEVILDGVRRVLEEQPPRRRVKFPLIQAKEKRKLRLTNAQIDEILFG